MKQNNNAKTNKDVQAIPQGVWEASRPTNVDSESKCTITTDLQGNGYPLQEEMIKNSNKTI